MSGTPPARPARGGGESPDARRSGVGAASDPRRSGAGAESDPRRSAAGAGPDPRRPGLDNPADTEGPPPIGGSWRRLYAAVILFLVLQILVYWYFTESFR